MTTDNVPPDRIDDALPDDERPGDATRDTAANAGRASRPGPSAVPERFAALELEGSEVVIYDRENATAWIQSDGAVPLAASDAGGAVDG